jgi:hypothetical protein
MTYWIVSSKKNYKLRENKNDYEENNNLLDRELEGVA